MDEDFKPIPEQAETTAEKYVDPYGDGPEDMPDPMPQNLQPSAEDDEAFEEKDPMQVGAPTG